MPTTPSGRDGKKRARYAKLTRRTVVVVVASTTNTCTRFSYKSVSYATNRFRRYRCASRNVSVRTVQVYGAFLRRQTAGCARSTERTKRFRGRRVTGPGGLLFVKCVSRRVPFSLLLPRNERSGHFFNGKSVLRSYTQIRAGAYSSRQKVRGNDDERRKDATFLPRVYIYIFDVIFCKSPRWRAAITPIIRFTINARAICTLSAPPSHDRSYRQWRAVVFVFTFFTAARLVFFFLLGRAGNV